MISQARNPIRRHLLSLLGVLILLAVIAGFWALIFWLIAMHPVVGWIVAGVMGLGFLCLLWGLIQEVRGQ